jgi:transposase
MGPSLAVEGSTTKEVFEAYLEQVLLPEVREGQVLIMDKLPAHKPNRMRELIEERGCKLLYLPSYSPDYNPIEEAFSKIKEILRRACVPGLARPCSKRSAKRYPRSVSGMPGDSSSTPVTILRVNYHETCCDSRFQWDRPTSHDADMRSHRRICPKGHNSIDLRAGQCQRNPLSDAPFPAAAPGRSDRSRPAARASGGTVGICPKRSPRRLPPRAPRLSRRA